MMETKGCSLYVAPALLRQIIALYGVDKVSMTIETTERDTGRRVSGGVIFFCDPPNSEIVEQFRQMERESERRMVGVSCSMNSDRSPRRRTNFSARYGEMP